MNFKKALRIILLSGLGIIIVVFVFFFVGRPKQTESITWGVNFSGKQARLLGLDPEQTYLSIIQDLGARKIKLSSYWNTLEPLKNEYQFSELDWYVEKAEEHEVEVFLVVGMKTPRWPECHIPEWADHLSPEEKEEQVQELVRKVVGRYEKSPAVWAFQIENEPFLNFGVCPDRPKGFLRKEVEVARQETDKPIIISDSGEWSFWSRVARIGDMVATTIYRRAWFDELNVYTTYPLPPVFYRRKTLLINWLFNKKVICGELQAEPWTPVFLTEASLEEKEKTMSHEKFEEIIDYARRTGIEEFYLWGAEWWYWLKLERNDPWYWERSRSLFLENNPSLK